MVPEISPASHSGMRSPTSQSPTFQSPGCLTIVVLVLAWWWVVSVTFGRIASQFAATSAITMLPNAAWAGFPALQGVLLSLPLMLLVIIIRSQPWRGILVTWSAASAYVLLLAPISLLPLTSSQAHALLTTLGNLLFSLLIQVFSSRRPRDISSSWWAAAAGPVPDGPASISATPRRVALVFLPVFALPWLAWGALGSFVDTALMLVAGLSFGWVVYRLLFTVLRPALIGAGYSPVVNFLLGGLITATAIWILASGMGFAFGGIQLLLAISLSPLGWLAAYWMQASDSSHASARAGLPVRYTAQIAISMLFGLAASFPLAFIDPDELALMIGARWGEILVYAIAAALVSAGVSLLFSAGALISLLASRRTPAKPTSPRITVVAVALLWVVALLIYILYGQPGFFGEGYFVVLERQADLSKAQTIEDPTTRRQYVYDVLVAHAEESQAGLRQDLDRFGIDYTPYYLINAIQVNGGPLVRLWLSTRRDISHITANPWMRPLPAPVPVSSGSASKPPQPLWNLTQINADRVWRELGITGEGVVIGLSDSGVQWDHPELVDSYRGSAGSHDYTWFDPWYGTAEPSDIFGHGTHTLGSILGDTTGVAPGAEWIACANLRRNLGNPALYVGCMQFMLAPFPLSGDPFHDGEPARGAQILNNSWGCPEFEGCHHDTLLPAIHALNQAGIFLVASATNDGPFCATVDDPPAIYEQVLTVGASDQFGNLSIFSSRGPVDEDDSNRIKPDLVAPGEQVLSSMPNSSYGMMSGTSMAGPHVTGVVALVWSANPSLVGDIEKTRQIIENTADPGVVSSFADCPGANTLPSTATGYGLVDAFAAVQAAMQLP